MFPGGRGSSGLSARAGWGLAGLEVALAAAPLPVGAALHLASPSTAVAVVVLVGGSGLALWRGWGPDRPRPRGHPARPPDFVVGRVAAVIAVCATQARQGAAVEPLGRSASLGAVGVVSALVVLSAPWLFGGARPR